MEVQLTEWLDGGGSIQHDLGAPSPGDAAALIARLDGERFDVLSIRHGDIVLFVGGGPNLFYVTADTAEGQRTAVVEGAPRMHHPIATADITDWVDLKYGGQLTDLPARNGVENDTATRAVAGLLSHGELPDTVSWE